MIKRNSTPPVRRAAETLAAGGIVVLPSTRNRLRHTAVALLSQPDAIARLKAFRNGNDSKPLTVHVAGREDALNYLGPVTDFENYASCENSPSLARLG